MVSDKKGPGKAIWSGCLSHSIGRDHTMAQNKRKIEVNNNESWSIEKDKI